MAAPATTVRGTPAGIRLEDGQSTKIAFNRQPDAAFWERTVQPPGVDGGDAINITTMLNTTWRTFVARNLKTLMPFPVTAAYNPLAYTQVVNNLINLEGSVTTYFPDLSKLDYFAYMKSFEPQPHVEGEMPTANINVVPTNYDPAARVEAPPVLTEIAGT